MGATNSTNKVKINQTITNDILQVSDQYCTISSSQSFNGNTLFFIGGKGDVTIKQVSTIDNATCNMSNVLDTQILNIMTAMSNQDITVTAGPTFSLNGTTNKTSMYLTTSNAVTQLMSSTCNITSSQTIDNNYVFAQDQQGDFLFLQESDITGATCTMGNAAKTVTENEQIAEGDQSATIKNVYGIFLAIIALGFVLMIVVIIGLLFSGKKGGGSSGSSTAQADYDKAVISADQTSKAEASAKQSANDSAILSSQNLQSLTTTANNAIASTNNIASAVNTAAKLTVV